MYVVFLIISKSILKLFQVIKLFATFIETALDATRFDGFIPSPVYILIVPVPETAVYDVCETLPGMICPIGPVDEPEGIGSLYKPSSNWLKFPVLVQLKDCQYAIPGIT